MLDNLKYERWKTMVEKYNLLVWKFTLNKLLNHLLRLKLAHRSLQKILFSFCVEYSAIVIYLLDQLQNMFLTNWMCIWVGVGPGRSDRILLNSACFDSLILDLISLIFNFELGKKWSDRGKFYFLIKV